MILPFQPSGNLMDLGQHPDPHIRKAFAYVLTLGDWGEAVMASLTETRRSTREGAIQYLLRWYSISFTREEASLIVDYMIACDKIRRVAARLEGKAA